MATGTVSYRQLLGLRDVRALLLATLMLRLASRMFSLAIVLYALARTGSPVLAGWLAFAAIAPGLAVSPIAGALIDRVGSVWAIIVDLASSAGFITALIVVDWFGRPNAPTLLTLVCLFSLTRPLTMAGVRALLPRLVPSEARDRANALDTSIHGVADICGPALAGTIVGFGGPDLALGTIAITHAAVAMFVSVIRRPRGEFPHWRPLLTDALSGVLRVVRSPTLRGMAVSYSFYEVAWGILVVVVPVFTARQFAGGAGAAAAGLLWAGLGLVGSIGALIAGHWQTAGRERRIMALGMLATAAAAWPIAGEFGLIGLMLGLMLFGAAAGPIDVAVLALRQRRTDPAELGRVLSVSMSLNIAGGPLGSALAGALVAWSLPGTLLVAAFASVLAAAATRLIPASDEAIGSGRLPSGTLSSGSGGRA